MATDFQGNLLHKKKGKVAIIMQGIAPRVLEYDLAEFQGLAKTAGYNVCTVITQNMHHPNAKFFIGKGKTEQLKQALDAFFHDSRTLTEESETALLNQLIQFDDVTPSDGDIEAQENNSDDEADFAEIAAIDDGSQPDSSNFVNQTGDVIANPLVLSDSAIAVSMGLTNQSVPATDELVDEKEPLVEEIVLDLPDSVKVRTDLTILFNNRLGHSQVLNLAKEFGSKVVDRDELILEIFDQNAHTREASLQIELARLAMQSSLIKKEIGQHLDEKQGRGGLGKGMPGWKSVARAFSHRRKKILLELAEITKARTLRRKGRGKFFNVGIIGYTNAGKTTLLNSLAKDKLETNNREFTTVSTTSRKVFFPTEDYSQGFRGDEVIFTDSVGFVEDLAHFMIQAFLSTLEELQFSNLILMVLDIAEKDETRLEIKIATTFEVLSQIGAIENRKLFVFNKADLLNPDVLASRIAKIQAQHPDIPYVTISALKKEGFQQLRGEILQLKHTLWDKQNKK